MTFPKTRAAAPALDIRGAFIRRTDLSHATLRGANLSGADCSGVLFRQADFQGALLAGTILRGADLTGATNLSIEQLSTAIIDELTKLPSYVDRARLQVAARSSTKLESTSF